MITDIISKLQEKTDLTYDEMNKVMTDVLSGKTNDSENVDFLSYLADKGETDDELLGMLDKMQEFSLKVEAKNAVRGSFKLGTTRTHIKEPHYKVKCHRSRSNISKSDTTNDRYLLNDFDLIVCNVSNAIFQGATLPLSTISFKVSPNCNSVGAT